MYLIKGKPLYTTWHEVWGKEYWTDYIGNVKGYLGYIVERLVVKLPNKIISISKHTTKGLIEKLKVSKEKIVTIPNGIEFEKIQKIKPSAEKSDIVFAGRLLSHKNVDMLIKSVSIIAKSNPKIKCIIIGDGPEKESLIKLTKQLNIEKNIAFKGFIEDYNQVLALIKSSKVFVLPSTREGFGIVVLEANACGIPVVTVNHQDNASKDLIKEGKNGFICKLNERELASNIINAIKLNSKMNQHCITGARRYDWGNLIQKFEEVYR